MVTIKKSSNRSVSSNAYTYYASGASTDLIQTETITNGEPIDNFVAGTTTYTPNNLNQLASTSNPNRTYVYDDDGNMTTGFTPEWYTLTMTYDAENRMTSAQYVNNGITYRTEYSYSGDSLLAEMKKKENGNITSTTKYLRAGFLPIQERDGSNAITREYTWGLNLGGGIGGLLNLKQGGSDYSYLYDGKGNVSSLINSSQIPVAKYAYDSFGVLMKKTVLDNFNQPYMFSTKPYDSQIGKSLYEFRFYDPYDGKWLQRDPLGEYGGINLYGAMNNSAMNWIDPWGLATTFIETPMGPVPFYVPTNGNPSQLTPQQWQDMKEALKWISPVTTLENIKYWWNHFNEGASGEKCPKEQTPDTKSDDFEKVKRSKAKRHKDTGEIWEKDPMHKDHWEVYKNKKNWEKGTRDRSVWDDGRIKNKF